MEAENVMANVAVALDTCMKVLNQSEPGMETNKYIAHNYHLSLKYCLRSGNRQSERWSFSCFTLNMTVLSPLTKHQREVKNSPEVGFPAPEKQDPK